LWISPRSFVCRWRSRMLTVGKFRCTSIPMAEAVNWHLREFKGGTRSQFSTHNVTHFMFCEPGIRHEDPWMIKVRQQLPIYIIKLDLCSLTERDVTQIFPLSLHRLLALDDRVQQFSIELDGIRICHGCGRKAASLKRCRKCSSFWYCDRVRPP
jgi:hypothetical protein